MTLPRRPVIERVVTQHAEDAAVLRATRATLVRSPHVELHRLARHDERLSAHLDGLRVAGEDGFRMGAVGDSDLAARLARDTLSGVAPM